MVDDVTKRAQEMYDAHPFGDFSYGRASRERSDPHLMKFLKATSPDDQVYDIGCGVGFWFDTYHSVGIPKDHIVGLDLAPVNVHNLTARGYEVHLGNILDLPFPMNVADTTICYGVIMVTSSPERAFQELVRITKPNGRIFVAVYNQWHPYFWFIYKFTHPLRYIYWNWSKSVANVVYPFFWVFFQLVTRITQGGFLDSRSCRTVFMDQVITPSARLYGKKDLQRFADRSGCEVLSFGYSRLYAMLSAAFIKNVDGSRV